MKTFDYHMLHKITNRSIDDIALLALDNKRKYPKQYIEDWISEFRSFSECETHNLINSIFDNQCHSIDEACINNTEYITIPTLGHLRLNKSRQDILFTIYKEGTITDDRVKEIIAGYVAQKELLKKEILIDIKLNLK